MSPKILAVTIFGVGTIAAAAVGGYSALRRDTPDTPKAALETDVAVKPADAIAEAPAVVPQPTVQMADEAPAKAKPAATKATAPAKAPRNVARAPQASAPARQVRNAPEPVAPAASNAPVAPPVAPVATDAARNEPSDERPAPVAAAPEPPKPVIEELTITRDSVIGIRLETAVSSQTAKLEDKVTARVARDVAVDGRTALSSGSRLEGVVASVDRGGKFKDRARIGIRFTTLVLADNTRIPINTETIYREGDSPTGPAATKVAASSAIGGVLGAVLGGKKGALIGSTVGAAGGAATVAAGSGPDAVLGAGTPLTVRLTSPLTMSILKPQD